jgi:hypothetical protein
MRRALVLLPFLLLTAITSVPAARAEAGAEGGTLALNGFLGSLGVNPGEAVIQSGARNYAGPNCPGAGWTCTDGSGVVVQVSSSGGDDGGGDDGANVFVCSPAGPGTDPGTNTCVIVQVSEQGSNRAICREHDTAQNGLVQQTCSITQTNSRGPNVAVVNQSVMMRDEDGTQRSEQRSQVVQTNGSGSNEAVVVQRSTLSATVQSDDGVDSFQMQDAIQSSSVDQQTGVGLAPEARAGNNRANLVQSHRLDAEAEEAASAEQLQNSTSPVGQTACFYNPNGCALFEQSSTNGRLLIHSLQTLRHDVEAEDIEGAAFQQQGSSPETGGLAAIFHQDSAGVARRVTAQDERQTADADDTGPVTQIQFTGQGPKKNSNQEFHPDNSLFGSQTVVQKASDPTFQQATLDAEAGFISGEGTFRQFARQNDATEQQTVTGGPGFILARIDCTQGEPPGDGDGEGDGEIGISQEEDPCVATSETFPGEGGTD